MEAFFTLLKVIVHVNFPFFLYAIDIDDFYFHLVSVVEQRKIWFLFLSFIDNLCVNWKTNTSVFIQVKQLIENLKMLQPESIKLESNLVDDLGFDSLEIIEFYLAIEEHFSINIPDEDRLKLLTVDDVVNYVTSHSRAN